MAEYKTIFNREGNKKRYLDKLYKHFPLHTTYIEPFLGTGAVFFNKPLAKYNMLNDSSDFIYQFFKCFMEDKERLIRQIEITPIYSKILKEECTDMYDSVARKVLLLCACYMNNGSATVMLKSGNDKDILLENIALKMFDKIQFARLDNKDCIDFLESLSFRSNSEIKKTFIYCDPPYLVSYGRLDDNKGWSEEKLRNLIEHLISTGCKFAISEFNDDLVINIFKEYGLNIEVLGDNTGIGRKTSKKEILAMNYTIQTENLFFTENQRMDTQLAK